MDRPRASCGYIVSSPRDLSVATCTVIDSSKYDFVCVPIVHPRYKFPEKPSVNQDETVIVRHYPHTRSDFSLRSAEWMSAVVGVLTRDLNLESADAKVRTAAIERLLWELNYATHLGKLLLRQVLALVTFSGTQREFTKIWWLFIYALAV